MTPSDLPFVHVRTMRADDRAAVHEISRHTWAWGDYLAGALDEWMSRPDGVLRVAVTPEDEVIGFQYYRLLNHAICWLSGLRVHPDYRSRGIGTLMLEDAIGLARSEGMEIVRYAAETGNDAVQRMSREHGFRPRGTWLSFLKTMDEEACALQRSKNAKNGQAEETRTVPPDRVSSVLSLLGSEGHAFYVYDWTWRDLNKQAVLRLAEDGSVIESRSGLGGWSVGIVGRRTPSSMETALFGADPACAFAVLAHIQRIACQSPTGVHILTHVPQNEPAANLVADLARRGHWRPMMEHSLRIWELRLNP